MKRADLRIPWEKIINVEGLGILEIQLTDGIKIEESKVIGSKLKIFSSSN
jgi:hypothetical protein